MEPQALLIAFAATGLIGLLCLIFILGGLGFFSKVLVSKNIAPEFLCPMGFFLGMAVFFTGWTSLEAIIGRADISLFITLTGLIALGIWQKTYVEVGNWLRSLGDNKVLSLFLFFILPIGFILARVYPSKFDIDVHLGSGSTILYFNKALYFYLTNSIPSLSVSIGQSLLASASLFFGLKSTGLFNLSLWTYMGLLMFSCLIYGFFRHIELTRCQARWGTFFVCFGNASLSLLPICVVDSGVPFILGMYALTFFTVGSFSTALFLFHLHRSEQLKQGLSLYVLIFFLVFSWAFTSPESMAMGIPAILIYIAWQISLKKIQWNKMVPVAALVIVAILFGITQGGLLSPSRFRDVAIEQSIPGWQHSPIGQKFKINPGLDFSATIAPAMFAVQYPSGQRFHAGNRGKDAVIPYEFVGSFSNPLAEKLNRENLKKSAGLVLILETELWHALRVLFLPIFGVVVAFLCLRSRSPLIRDFVTATAVVFLGGFILALLPYQSGLKWPFTRFLLPSYALAQICCFLSFLYLLKLFSWPEKRKFQVLGFIICVLAFGQTLAFTTHVIANVGSLNEVGEDVWTRAERMVTVDSIVPPN